MKQRMRILQGERDGLPTPSTNTQLTVKKTRKHPKAKMRTLLRRAISKANTRQRRGTNLKAAARAEKGAGGQRAERKITSIKVMTEEVAQEAKSEMLKRKKGSQKLITVKTGIRATSRIKSIKRTPKEETVRKLGQSHKARKGQRKMGADLAAETGIGVDLQDPKNEKRNEKKAGRGAEIGAGVGIGDTRGGEPPGIRSVEQEAQTGAGTEAGGPEARAARESAVKIGRLIERTETERLRAKEDDTATAPTVTETETREEGAKKALILKGAERKVPPNPKTGGVRTKQDPIVQKAKTETTARKRNPAPAPALAPALTATDPRSRFGSFDALILYPPHIK